jgi:hypothetical protein
MKGNEMGCNVAREREMRNAKRFWAENRKSRNFMRMFVCESD